MLSFDRNPNFCATVLGFSAGGWSAAVVGAGGSVAHPFANELRISERAPTVKPISFNNSFVEHLNASKLTSSSKKIQNFSFFTSKKVYSKEN